MAELTYLARISLDLLSFYFINGVKGLIFDVNPDIREKSS